MEELRKKYSSLTNLLTSSSNLIILFLLGLILIGFGVLAYKIDIFSSGDKVEVLNNSTETQNAGPESTQDIIVEINGAVEKPDVYKLPFGSRIDDLLISAGGLAVDADRSWVEKNINRASKLIDGQKIYIYSLSDTLYHSGESSANYNGGIKLDQGVSGPEGFHPASLININTGSQSELEKLVGIGPVYATNIIEHRPYSDLQELVTRGAISQKVLEKIKGEIVVR